MLVVAGVAGLVFLLLLAALSVAWLALPGGRFCPRCGEPTHPVVLRPWIRIPSRVLHWRWCAGCGWEGLGRPPRTPAPGKRFRWRPPGGSTSPVFRWRDRRRSGEGRDEAPREEPVGREAEPPPDHPGPGFRWKRPEDGSGPTFFWA